MSNDDVRDAEAKRLRRRVRELEAEVKKLRAKVDALEREKSGHGERERLRK
jgi:cell division protein FtsB